MLGKAQPRYANSCGYLDGGHPLLLLLLVLVLVLLLLFM